MADGTDRLRLEFSPEAGASVPIILERLRRVASDLPIEDVDLGPVCEPPPAELGCEPPRVVVLTLPRCPRCGLSKHLKVDGTQENSEATKRQRVRCLSCGHRFNALWS
jgi:hypothetical protein